MRRFHNNHNREEIIFDRKRSSPDPSSRVISRSSESWAHQPGADKKNIVFFQFVSNTRKERSECGCEGGDRVKIQDLDETMSIQNGIMTV